MEDLKILLKDIPNYNKYMKKNPDTKKSYRYNWYAINDIIYLISGAGIENIDNKQLKELIMHIKNPKVLESAEDLKIINISLENFLSKLNNEDQIITSEEYTKIEEYLNQLNSIYMNMNMEHGSKCAKRIYIKNIKKNINSYRLEVGP